MGKVCKMTFYRYFSNKEVVVLSIIQEIYDAARVRFNDEWRKGASFEEKLKPVIKMKIELISGFSNEFLRDISIGDIPQIEELIGKEKIKSFKTVKKFCRRPGKKER